MKPTPKQQPFSHYRWWNAHGSTLQGSINSWLEGAVQMGQFAECAVNTDIDEVSYTAQVRITIDKDTDKLQCVGTIVREVYRTAAQRKNLNGPAPSQTKVYTYTGSTLVEVIRNIEQLFIFAGHTQ